MTSSYDNITDSDVTGPKPNAARDLKMEAGPDGGYLLSWKAPVEKPDVPVNYYSLRYKPGEGKWKRLGPEQIADTKYLGECNVSVSSFSVHRGTN